MTERSSGPAEDRLPSGPPAGDGVPAAADRLPSGPPVGDGSAVRGSGGYGGGAPEGPQPPVSTQPASATTPPAEPAEPVVPAGAGGLPETAKDARLDGPSATAPAALGVPPRSTPLPPPRDARPLPADPAGPPSRESRLPRPAPAARLPVRGRKARLVLKRIDAWSVFLHAMVASLFVGLATFLAIAFLYVALSQLGVLASLNTLIGDVTRQPGSTVGPTDTISANKVLTFGLLVAALNVVLLTALATLGAFLYNLVAALSGGIEVTLSESE